MRGTGKPRWPWKASASCCASAGPPSLDGPLEHWHYDTFVARWRDRTVPDAFVTFALRPDGQVEQFKMSAFSPSADFSYDYQDLLFTPVRK